MLTGLEAYTTYCKWYPDQNSITNRIVEGFYILTDMPYIGRNHRGIIKHLEPAEFSSDTKNAILNLMVAVYDLWDESDPIRKDWIKWHEEHRQCDANAAVYSNKPYYTPLLKSIFCSTDFYGVKTTHFVIRSA